jgi:hypothetical protein
VSDRIHGSAGRISSTAAARRQAIGQHPIAELQRSAGNRAIQRLVEGELDDLDGDDISRRIGDASGGGHTLDPPLRQQLGSTLGSDPGDVRIHTDGEADSLSRALGAKAFTTGRDVFFSSGSFDPSTPEGFGLLAHESTHVLQQAAGPVAGTPTADGALSISDPGDSFERAASSSAARAAPAAETAAAGAMSVQRLAEDELMGDPAAAQSTPAAAEQPLDDDRMA